MMMMDGDTRDAHGARDVSVLIVFINHNDIESVVSEQSHSLCAGVNDRAKQR